MQQRVYDDPARLPPTGAGEGSSWPHQQFRAMGSTITLWLEARADTAAAVFAQARAQIARAEHTLSRFEKHSELSRLNARPHQWVIVSPLLWDVLAEAFALASTTGGLFDPTLLASLEALGYSRSFLAMHGVAQASSGQAAPGRWMEVQIDAARRAVWLPQGVRLDLGGVAKGYIAEKVVQWLSHWGPCLIDAGGDLVAGAAPAGMPGWPVATAAPSAGDAATVDLFHLWLAHSTLATSGIDYRCWQKNGLMVHHIIDPRTGQPARTDVLTVSVLAPEAARAEGWATAALVAGKDMGITLLTQQGLAAAVVGQGQQLSMTPAMAAHLVWSACP